MDDRDFVDIQLSTKQLDVVTQILSDTLIETAAENNLNSLEIVLAALYTLGRMVYRTKVAINLNNDPIIVSLPSFAAGYIEEREIQERKQGKQNG